MPSQGLDRRTSRGDTALHVAASHDKPECIKLLLRSGADTSLRNGDDKTAQDISREHGYTACEELVSKIRIFPIPI